MGNTPSTPNKSPETEFKNFYDVIDYIATYYILTMDFKSLSKLSDKEYCDKLIILTSDIIQKYFNEHEITFLEQRVKEGVVINSLSSEKILFIDKDKLNSLDMSNDTKKSIQKNVKKNRVCIGIAKFYVKIAHIFAAIIMTINPVYTYTDTTTGQTMKTTLLEKDKIPKKANRKLFKINICDNRIRALRKNEVLDESTGNVTIEPQICDINSNTFGTTKTLQEEPGIPEFMQLYYDNFDETTGTFSGMSPQSKSLFDRDLKLFYTAFTGEQNMPPEVTKFSDIKLRDYNKNANCTAPDGKFRSKIQINKNDDLFIAYADNLRRMVKTAASNQYKLLNVINELFTYTTDSKTGKKIIKVNPNLTEASLQQNVELTRKLIIDLYVKCETDYEQGVKIYTALVESKNAVIVPRQIQSLKEKSDKLVQSIQVPMSSIEEDEKENILLHKEDNVDLNKYPSNMDENESKNLLELNIDSDNIKKVDNEKQLEEPMMKMPIALGNTSKLLLKEQEPQQSMMKPQYPLEEPDQPQQQSMMKPPYPLEEPDQKQQQSMMKPPYPLEEQEQPQQSMMKPSYPLEESDQKQQQTMMKPSYPLEEKYQVLNPNNIKDTFELKNEPSTSIKPLYERESYIPPQMVNNTDLNKIREIGGKIRINKKTRKNKKIKITKKTKKLK